MYKWLERWKLISSRPPRFCSDLETAVRKSEWKGETPSRGWPPLAREVDLYVRLARKGSPRHVLAILQYFAYVFEKSVPVDSRVRRYLDGARRRHRRDPRRDMAKALRLVRAHRGNPGRIPYGKRAFTEEEFVELGQMVVEKQRMGWTEKAAVLESMEYFGVKERTAREAARAWKSQLEAFDSVSKENPPE